MPTESGGKGLKRQPITQDQLNRLQEMLDKKYRITSLRYNYLDGYMTVGVSLKGGRAVKVFFIGLRGELK